MHPNTTLKLSDGSSVVVPDSLNLISTYVLREQGDWFEDEIQFVRSYLKPNQRAIDIGANYGVFTLSMAKVVGPNGKVWAFESASSTAALLAESLALNGFSHVVLDERDFFASSGTVSPSLDSAMQELDWSDIEFVRIGAGAGATAILQGGVGFFDAESPLVQYKFKTEADYHVEMVQAFSEKGYSSYRLVPGLGILVPFSVPEGVDGYLLNLFCCKPDRAAKLASEGLLVLPEDFRAPERASRVEALLHNPENRPSYRWQDSLTLLPYGRFLKENWQKTAQKGLDAELEKALALHALAHDSKVPEADRFVALRTSLELLSSVCSKEPDYLRLLSLARVAREFGAREHAVSALNHLVELAVHFRQVNPNEPFLAGSERFDHLDPKEAIAD